MVKRPLCVHIIRICCLCILATVASCSQEWVPAEQQQEEVPVQFSVAVLSKAMRSSLEEENASFGVYADKQYSELDTTVTVFANQQVSFQSQQWVYAPLRFWDNDAEYHFFAYYPYDDTGKVSFENGCFTITGYDAATQNDVMIAQPQTLIKGVHQAVRLEFRHLLTNVCVVLKSSDDWGTPVELLSLCFKGMKMTGTYAEYDDVWTTAGNNYDGSAMGTSYPASTILSQQGDTYLSGLLMIPQPMSPTVKLLLNYKSEENYYSKEVVFLNKGITSPWEKGQRIVYTMTIAPNNIYFDRPQVFPWSSSDAGSETILL